jgi:hypothetical protein
VPFNGVAESDWTLLRQEPFQDLSPAYQGEPPSVLSIQVERIENEVHEFAFSVSLKSLEKFESRDPMLLAHFCARSLMHEAAHSARNGP